MLGRRSKLTIWGAFGTEDRNIAMGTVMSPADTPAEIWLMTRWRDEQSYRSWHRGHEYHELHRGIPNGLKLVPGSTDVRLFEVFAD